MEPQERIVAKAHELFMRYGIRSISMDEIATHLGISKKTIYQFFTDKDSLVSAVVDIEIETNERDCLLCHNTAKDPVHEICLVISQIEEMLQIMNPSVIFDMQKYHLASFRKFEAHINGFMHDMVKANLLKGIEMDLYRPEIDVELLTHFRLTSVFMVFNPEYFPTGKFDLGRALREITYNFLYGITNSKGQKLITKYNQERTKKVARS